MSTENETIVDTGDDLDLFSADFFGQNEAVTEPASSEDTEDADAKEVNAPTEDTHGDGDDSPEIDADEEDSDPEDDKEPVPESPKKKNRFQERIDEVVGKQRETERQLTAALAAIEEFKQNKQTEPTPQVAAVNTGPDVNDVNEDGTDKYPLGEFDPGYIRDLTRHALHEERAALKQQDEAEAVQRQQDAQRAELQSNWMEKLGPAKERYPDLEAKGAPFLEHIGSQIDAAYGEYLTTVLMGIEHGPDVLNYLVNNPDLADNIVKSGYTKATLALGAINAKFEDAEREKQSARPRVSKAPTPPPHVNKGSAPAAAEVPDDTDDLDAFERKLFKKKA